jgi:hypothetical protein
MQKAAGYTTSWKDLPSKKAQRLIGGVLGACIAPRRGEKPYASTWSTIANFSRASVSTEESGHSEVNARTNCPDSANSHSLMAVDKRRHLFLVTQRQVCHNIQIHIDHDDLANAPIATSATVATIVL